MPVYLPCVTSIIFNILQALADESEFVRETALKAGQRVVNMYADTAIELLLPELERGLFGDNWCIRYSSVQLLGDLLYKLSGNQFMQSKYYFAYQVVLWILSIFIDTWLLLK